MPNTLKGLNLHIEGAPVQAQHSNIEAAEYGVLASDYYGLKARFLVEEGEYVTVGQPLFIHRDDQQILYTAPVSGKVKTIHRGMRRAFISLIIEAEKEQVQSTELNESYKNADLKSKQDVQKLLFSSGLFSLIQRRPYGKVPHSEEKPNYILVNLIDTEPHAPQTQQIISENLSALRAGIDAMFAFSDRVFVAKSSDLEFDIEPGKDERRLMSAADKLQTQIFNGEHPTGNSGVQINHICPVSVDLPVWTVGTQQLVSIGKFLQQGKLDLDRYVTISGPACKEPRRVKLTTGANLQQVLGLDVDTKDTRLVAGSLLNGATCTDTTCYLGARTQQVSLINEGGNADLLSWIKPSSERRPANSLSAKLRLAKVHNPTNTLLYGDDRALVFYGQHDEISPFTFPIAPLLRALVVGDLEEAEALGCLDLLPEDLALFTYVCPSKFDYGSILRQRLDEIEASYES